MKRPLWARPALWILESKPRLAVLILIVGCLLAWRPQAQRHQAFTIESSPSGAQVELLDYGQLVTFRDGSTASVNQRSVGRTPGPIDLPEARTWTVLFRLPGYHDHRRLLKLEDFRSRRLAFVVELTPVHGLLRGPYAVRDHFGWAAAGLIAFWLALASLKARRIDQAYQDMLSRHADAEAQVGDLIGPYRLQSRLGRGGMAQVFLGRDEGHPHSDLVAVKCLLPSSNFDDGARQRFLREIEICRELRDPHLVFFYDCGIQAGMLYFALEYVRGKTLEDRVRESVDPAQVLRWHWQVSQALQIIHARGLVHRDVKPANIMILEGSQRAKLMDFGIAQQSQGDKLTQAGTFLGTPGYVAPEQFCGLQTDWRADYYALASSLFYCLARTHAFPGETPLQILKAQQEGHFRSLQELRPELPGALVELVESWLQKEAGSRGLREIGQPGQRLEAALQELERRNAETG